MIVATLGQIKKIDIENSTGSRVGVKTVLCSDSHVSYKGFAIDKSLEYHAVIADLKQYAKEWISHVQHVNSMHDRLNKGVDEKFWRVSTKHL